MDKPHFNVEQVSSATYASNRFREIREKAKEQPQFIFENNCVDTVVLDYKVYEQMYTELEGLREMNLELELGIRLKKADSTNNRYSLQDVLGEDEYKEFRNIIPNSGRMRNSLIRDPYNSHLRSCMDLFLRG
ncbi:hypothetical protein M3210_19925 [Oceanobacillus luteolus]|uniref:Type II toxin-antitoxin system Phd/YefM family antitoxin n=1 Tax=Oceanobacillus luteolus TaxID=1274358 RepID=A0ABW4HTF9_9BACI|nr:hypothetical protein [Oceanobacillus luteolus]MCM3742461.1 hypothetical protein [Oceanobacillus luteolus]